MPQKFNQNDTLHLGNIKYIKDDLFEATIKDHYSNESGEFSAYNLADLIKRMKYLKTFQNLDFKFCFKQ